MRVRVAAIVVNEGKILLVKHCKDGNSYWLLPGGGVEVGEVISESLRRELKEELNIEINLFEMLFVVESVSNSGKHLVQPTFLVTNFSIKNLKLGKDPRVCGFDFFSKNQLKDITIYPDINDELISILEYGKKSITKRYILKEWKN